MTRLLPFSAVAPQAWPPALRRFQDLRAAKAGPFTKRNVAATWRSETFKLHIWSVSYFVGWLNWSSRLKSDADLTLWVTPEIMGAYVEDMRAAGLSPRTIATRLDGVRAALAALSPETPTSWLMQGINTLRAEPSDRRRTQARTQHTARIVELGVSLMKRAVADGGDATQHERAVLYRDGLIIMFMALAVPRRNTVSLMLLGQHLIQQDDGYRVAWSAQEMKENRSHGARLGPELSAPIQRYLDEFRPVLAAKGNPSPGAEVAVWLNKRGQPLQSRAIYDLIVDRTKTAFGIPMFPHAFRHSAATTLVLERPDLIKLVTPLLQHRDSSSREIYVLADHAEAGQRFGAVIAARRGWRRRPTIRREQAAGRWRDDGI
jgi:integrase/recombinase XerD